MNSNDDEVLEPSDDAPTPNTKSTGSVVPNLTARNVPPTSSTGTRIPIQWGIIGNNQWGAIAQAGKRGIRREIGAGIDHIGPTSPDRSFRQALPSVHWVPVPNMPQNYDMVWDGSDEALQLLLAGNGSVSVPPKELASLTKIVFTFEHLGLWIRHAGIGTDAATIERRSFFDQVIGQFLEVCHTLHEHGMNIGLVQPDNVLVVPVRGGGVEVVLPDMEFYPAAKIINKPKWLKPRENPYLELRDADPARRTPASKTPLSAAERKPDIRIVARLISSLLTNRIEKEIPTPDQVKTTAQIWLVLDRAVAGMYDSLAVLEFELTKDAHQPSQHFVTQKAPPVRATRGAAQSPAIATWGLLAVGLIGLGAVGWYVRDLLRQEPLAEVSPLDITQDPVAVLPPESALSKLPALPMNAGDRTPEQLKAVFAAPLSQDRKIREAELQLRESKLYATLVEWQISYVEARKTLHADPNQKTKAALALKKLYLAAKGVEELKGSETLEQKKKLLLESIYQEFNQWFGNDSCVKHLGQPPS